MSKSEWTKKDIELTENKNLDCHNCRFKGSMVATCMAFENLKPLDVLRGGKCPKKEVEK